MATPPGLTNLHVAVLVIFLYGGRTWDRVADAGQTKTAVDPASH